MDVEPRPVFELRDYEVLPGRVDDWLSGWRAGVVPLRQQCGFEFVGAWLDRPGNRFVWILTHGGPEPFDAAEERYHSLAQRGALRPEPSSFVASARITRVVPISTASGSRSVPPVTPLN
jgi:hypothetical protein